MTTETDNKPTQLDLWCTWLGANPADIHAVMEDVRALPAPAASASVSLRLHQEKSATHVERVVGVVQLPPSAPIVLWSVSGHRADSNYHDTLGPDINAAVGHGLARGPTGLRGLAKALDSFAKSAEDMADRVAKTRPRTPKNIAERNQAVADAREAAIGLRVIVDRIRKTWDGKTASYTRETGD